MLDVWMRVFVSSRRLLFGLPILLLWAAGSIMARAQGPGKPAAQSGPASAVTSSQSGTRRLEPVYIPPVTVLLPWQGSGQGLSTVPALGDELASALIAVLRDANLDARSGGAQSSAGGRGGESENTMSGRLDAAGGERVRLAVSWHGTPASVIGDLEHLDDLVYAVFEQLRPRLLAEVSPVTPLPALLPDPTPEPAPAATTPEPAPGTLKDQAHPKDHPDRVTADRTPADASSSATHKHPAAHPHPSSAAQAQAKPGAKEIAAPLPEKTPEKLLEKLPEKTPEKLPEKTPDKVLVQREPPGPGPASNPASTPPGGATSPPNETAPPRPPTASMPRPRVAVHVVGEPLSSLPPSFYGLGTISQQILIQYLQTRLRVAPVPSRLSGLVGGIEAMNHSLRLGSRHSLMVRFDTLVDGPGSYAYGVRTLSGRLHVVLLLDSRPVLDHSLTLPQTPYYPMEAPSAVLGRMLSAAMDGIANELSARLYAVPPVLQ